MTTLSAVSSALAALGAGLQSSEDVDPHVSDVLDGRASVVSAAGAPTRAAVARIGAAYALLALPAGDDGVRAARALLEETVLPLADELAVAPSQRDTARKALIGASLALEQLVKGRNVRVAPVVLTLHPEIEKKLNSLDPSATSSTLSPDSFPEEFCDDLKVLNSLQATVGRWNAEIDRVISAARNGPETVLSADEEQLFWASVDSAFESIQSALSSPGVVVSLQLLARKRRATGFMSDISHAVDEGRRHAQGVLNFVQGLPVMPLRTADDLPSLLEAVRLLLSHIAAKLRLSSFPLNRALTLVSSLFEDLAAALKKLLLRNNGLLGQPLQPFRFASECCGEIFLAWREGYENCRMAARERAAARGEVIVPPKLPDVAPLENRIREIVAFRNEHSALVAVVEQFLKATGGAKSHANSFLYNADSANSPQMTERTVNDKRLSGNADISSASFHGIDSLARDELMDGVALRKLNTAYDTFVERCSGPISLDISPDGESLWSSARGTYAMAITDVENTLAAMFQLAVSNSPTLAGKAIAGAPFATVIHRAVFMPAVNVVLGETIDVARFEILKIREALKLISFPAPDALAPCRIPRVSLHVVTLRQLANAVDEVVSRVSTVVGRSRLETDLDIRDLRRDGEMLKNLINPDTDVQRWLETISLRSVDSFCSVFRVARPFHGRRGVALSVREIDVFLSKEIKMLQELGYSKISSVVVESTRQYASIQPYFSVLKEALHAHGVALRSLLDLKDEDVARFRRVFRLLVARKQSFLDALEDGISVKWGDSSDTLEHFCGRLRNLALRFSSITLTAIGRDDLIESSLCQLSSFSCRISNAGVNQDDLKHICKILHRIHMAATDISSCEHFENADSYVSRYVITRVDRALRRLYFRCVEQWVAMLDAGDLDFATVVLTFSPELRRVAAYPSLVAMEQSMFDSFLAILHTFCEIRPESFGFSGVHFEDDRGVDYGSLLRKNIVSKRNISEFSGAFKLISEKIRNAFTFLDEWARFEPIWELDASLLLGGERAGLAEQCDILEALLSARGGVAEYIGLKSRSAHREAFGFPVDVSTFAGQVSSRLSELITHVSKSCVLVATEEMNAVYSLASETHALLRDAHGADIFDVLLMVQSVEKDLLPLCEARSSLLATAESLLLSIDGAIPRDSWIEHCSVDAMINVLRGVFEQRQRNLEVEAPALKVRLGQLGRELESQVAELYSELAKFKTQSAENADVALAADTVYEMSDRLQHLGAMYDRSKAASSALAVSHAVSDEEFDALVNELQRAQEVVKQLSATNMTLEELSLMRFYGFDAKHVRISLQEVSEKLSDMGGGWKDFAAARALKDSVAVKLRFLNPLHSLSTAKLSPGREREVCETLFGTGSNCRHFHDLCLGDFWQCDLNRQERYLRAALESAAGEASLASFLKSISDKWTARRVQFVPHARNKVYLIKGMSGLVDDANEHLHALHTMAGSPYARYFESERVSWEQRLSNLRDEIETWADVQTRWLHLGTLFGDDESRSATLRAQMRDEYSAFTSVQSRFADFTARAKGGSGILEIMDRPTGLERMLLELKAVVRGLSTFLEKQRFAFPRFFYLSDEDLLSLLSISCENIDDLTRHLPKLFPGVGYLQFESGERTSPSAAKVVTGVLSKEGESLTFPTPIVVQGNANIESLLRELDRSLTVTLRSILSVAFSKMHEQLYLDDSSQGMQTSQQELDVLTFPAQLIILAAKLCFCARIEEILKESDDVSNALKSLARCIERNLTMLTDKTFLEPVSKAEFGSRLLSDKREQLMKEFVYQRTVLSSLMSLKTSSVEDYQWRGQLRFYASHLDDPARLRVHAEMADAVMPYGWEYLGVGETLVQTDLTRRCFLTLTQALKHGLGGSPFGPAGTGKTESVKSLGRLLGRFVAVFNCDESFDAVAVGRILAGISQTGSWVCFDEFNRLSAGILSTTSNQLATLQRAIQRQENSVQNFYGASGSICIVDGAAVFVTMNPTYTGRHELPQNLSSLFRSVAMTRPDSVVIAEVSLFAQGFATASSLAAKVVKLYDELRRSLPARSHYDFGLRCLKSTIIAAGSLLRREKICEKGDDVGDQANSWDLREEEIIVSALYETVKPVLYLSDSMQFCEIMEAIFSASLVSTSPLPDQVLAALQKESTAGYYELNPTAMEKIAELYRILRHRCGVMLLGPTGCGKTTTWRLLHAAAKRAYFGGGEKPGKISSCHSGGYSLQVIDPKLITTDRLYGVMDPTTREWTDGIFTKTIRDLGNSCVNNVADADINDGSGMFHWIVFDGDVDPIWAENLNSVLDDSRVLTLPTGERLAIPANMRILFEIDSVRYANPSTISRCGMVCFSPPQCMTPVARRLQGLYCAKGVVWGMFLESVSEFVPVVADISSHIQRYGSPALNPHPDGILETLFAVFDVRLQKFVSCHDIPVVEIQESQIPMAEDQKSLARLYARKSFLVVAASTLSSSLPREGQTKLCEDLLNRVCEIVEPADAAILLPQDCNLCSVFVDPATSEYTGYSSLLPNVSKVEIDPLRVGDPDVIVPTNVTVRNWHHLENIAKTSGNTAVIFCGPPGCGKSMLISDVFSSLPDVELASISFSSSTSPTDVLATLRAHSTMYKRASGEMCLRPKVLGSRLVLFCDEVNLGQPDAYGTQTAAALLRQIVEWHGFWDGNPLTWVRLENVQVVAACNPPEHHGRQDIPPRLLRKCLVFRLDLPAGEELVQIYSALNSAMLGALDEQLVDYSSALTNCMIEVYERNMAEFASRDSLFNQPHYVYSPRDLSRWLRGVRHILLEQDELLLDRFDRMTENDESYAHNFRFDGPPFEADMSRSCFAAWSDLLSSLVHEARRLFIDRLIAKEEIQTAERVLLDCVQRHMGLKSNALPDQWYSAWPRSSRRDSTTCSVSLYRPIPDVERFRMLVYRKLRSFCDEEGLGGAWMSGSGAEDSNGTMIDQFAVTDDVLKHLTRVERILRVPLGHAVLVGAPGSGKKTLARFAAWMGNMSVHQVRSHAEYTAVHFAEDLRTVLLLAGVTDEQVMLIFDESNALDGEFLEMMNAILACGEVPGLFDGEHRASLIASLRKKNHGSLTACTEETLYRKFIQRVRANLHVVFTLSCVAPGDKMKPNQVTIGAQLMSRSPALYNRCIVNWMGDWQKETLESVADLKLEVSLGNERQNIVRAAIFIHEAAAMALDRCSMIRSRVCPRHYLEFMEQLNRIALEKADDIQLSASRLKNGLGRLQAAGATVDELKKELGNKAEYLRTKEGEAHAMLSAMAEEQRKAEKGKVDAEELASAIAKAADCAEARREEVKNQLSVVEPKVEAARSSVGSIRKENLEELRAMPSPPAGVRLALEGVVTLLDCASGRSDAKLSWGVMRTRMRNPDFIPSVINFDPDSIPPDLLQRMRDQLVSNPDFNIDRISYSSRAAGPLAEWTLASLEFAVVNATVAPLREEVERLDRQRTDLVSRRAEAEESVRNLERRILDCQSQYARLVSESERIRNEINVLGKKLGTAERVLDSLAGEWDRWMKSLNDYNDFAKFVWGNSVLAAAFVAYAGAMDEDERDALIEEWKQILVSEHVPFDRDLSLAEFLTSPQERAIWAQAGLPTDKASNESYSILKRSARYPLIIDPSRTADRIIRAVLASSRDSFANVDSDVAKSQNRSSSLSKVSFLSRGKQSYLRAVESAMRFGTAVLVEDAEHFENSLTAVLGQEATTGDSTDSNSVESGQTGSSSIAGVSVVKSSHRLVRLADKDVDQSPAFRLFLSAAEAQSVPASAITRTCIVSFSFGKASLRARCLSKTLQLIHPELQTERTQILSTQLACEQKILNLESRVLELISGSDDDKESLLDGSLLLMLQDLKKEEDEANERISAQADLLRAVESVTAMFAPFVEDYLALFFVMDHLAERNALYKFSAEFFMSVYEACVRSVLNENTGKGDGEILTAIRQHLPAHVFRAVAPSLFPDDHVPFAAVLSVVSCKEVRLDELSEAVRKLLQMQRAGVSSPAGTVAENFNAETRSFWNDLTAPELISSINRLDVSALCHEGILHALASHLPGGGSDLVHSVNIQSDRVLRSELLGVKAKGEASSSSQQISVRPFLLCAHGAGVDPSAMAASFANEAGFAENSIALGDVHSIAVTQAAIDMARKKANRGSGKIAVIFKNVHLAPPECIDIFRKEILSHNGCLPYVLIISCEVQRNGTDMNIASLGLDCRVFAFEASSEFRATLSRAVSIACKPKDVTGRLSSDLYRALVAVAWIHASLLETCRYAPSGFSKPQGFSDADIRIARSTCSSLFSFDRNDFAFETATSMLCESVYGGRVDNAADVQFLSTLLRSTMRRVERFAVSNPDTTSVRVYDGEHADHSSGTVTLPFPDYGLEEVIEKLPVDTPAEWFGLDDEAKKERQVRDGFSALAAFAQMCGYLERTSSQDE